LSLEERSKIEYELHGVADLQEETQDMLQMRISEMNKALYVLLFTGKDTSAYEKALDISKDYVGGLKLAFLRAENYNGKEAAARLVRFFDRKRSLFGEAMLDRDIRLSDLDDEEMEALKQGIVMLLPQRDRSGRSIVVVNGRLNEMHSARVVMRVLTYVVMMAVQDFDYTQKRGMVLIYYGFGQKKMVSGRPLEFWISLRSLPIRIVACHYVGDGNVLTPAVRQFFAIAERMTVSRCRCHYGKSSF
jgi:hypothetical protein